MHNIRIRRDNIHKTALYVATVRPRIRTLKDIQSYLGFVVWFYETSATKKANRGGSFIVSTHPLYEYTFCKPITSHRARREFVRSLLLFKMSKTGHE